MKVMKITLTLLILLVLFSLEAVADSESFRLSHGGDVRCVAYSPDGSILASGSTDNKIHLWQTSDGTRLATLEEHTGDINYIVLSDSLWRTSRGEPVIATGSDDGTVRLWQQNESGDWERVWYYNFDRDFGWWSPFADNVSSIDFSSFRKESDAQDHLLGPDLLACGTRGKLVKVWSSLWGHKRWSEILTLTENAPVTSVAFMPQSGLAPDADVVILATATANGQVNLWEWNAWEWNATGFIELDKVKVGDPRTLYTHHAGIKSIAFSKTGEFLVCGCSDGSVILLQRQDTDGTYNYEHYDTLKGHTGEVRSVVFVSDTGQPNEKSEEHAFLTGSADTTIRAWKMRSRQDSTSEKNISYQEVKSHKEGVNSIAFASFEADSVPTFVLASSSNDGSVRQLVYRKETTDPLKGEGVSIDLELPEPFISQVAHGSESTYFLLSAELPEVPDGVVIKEYTITVNFPDGVLKEEIKDALLDPGFFVFPIIPPSERVKETIEEADKNLRDIIVYSFLGVIGSFTEATFVYKDMVFKVHDIIHQSKRSVKITMTPESFNLLGESYTAQPIFFLFLIEKYITEVETEIKLAYGPQSPGVLEFIFDQTYTVPGNHTWPLEDIKNQEKMAALKNPEAGAPGAPRGQPMSLSDYPPFQELPADVQAYLLKYFGEFSNAETWQIPEETSLLPNYPNPFNPETWLPYQLSEPAAVTVTIYDIQGRVVRALDLGHQRAGIYHSRSRAAHWDGRNAVGEPVASGLYFYTLEADTFTATRKMLIRK